MCHIECEPSERHGSVNHKSGQPLRRPPLLERLIASISSRKYILSDRTSLDCCQMVFQKLYDWGRSMLMPQSEMKVIVWIDHSCGFDKLLKRSWSENDLVTEWLRHWVIEWPRWKPHYVTIATSCHQLSLNPGPVWRAPSCRKMRKKSRQRSKRDKIFVHMYCQTTLWIISFLYEAGYIAKNYRHF